MRRRDKPPHNAQVLQRWTREWADEQGIPVARLQRSVSYLVLAAMLSRVRDPDGEALFLLKGGVAMELRLSLRARATQDVDAAVRADADELIEHLDDALGGGHDGFTATRTTADPVGTTGAVRVNVKLAYRGRPWGTVPLEIAPAEGRVGDERDPVSVRSLDPLGLGSPAAIPCVTIRYQIAQKLHACTQVFDSPPPNGRFRDLIDVLLLRELLRTDELPSLREACVEIFTLRATHAWPPPLTPPPSWAQPYAKLAAATGFRLTSVDDAADAVRMLIDEIDRS